MLQKELENVDQQRIFYDTAHLTKITYNREYIYIHIKHLPMN